MRRYFDLFIVATLLLVYNLRRNLFVPQVPRIKENFFQGHCYFHQAKQNGKYLCIASFYEQPLERMQEF